MVGTGRYRPITMWSPEDKELGHNMCGIQDQL